MTCHNGRRWSVNDAYLKPARDRDNLDVETGAFATRIVVEGERAAGVTYRARRPRDHGLGRRARCCSAAAP